MRPFPPIAFFTLFCLGTLAIVGFVLAASNGLSETHKTILVGFIVAFPAVTLLIFLILLSRAAAAPEYQTYADDSAAEPDVA